MKLQQQIYLYSMCDMYRRALNDPTIVAKINFYMCSMFMWYFTALAFQ